jgi:hypothetical protein
VPQADLPGYMVNYGFGAILSAEMRQQISKSLVPLIRGACAGTTGFPITCSGMARSATRERWCRISWGIRCRPMPCSSRCSD